MDTNTIEEHHAKQDPQYVRRPLHRVNHRKWKEAIIALKAGCISEELPARLRIRSAELLMLIHGVEIGIPSRKDRKDVKALVSRDAFQRELEATVHRGVISQVIRESRQEAKRVLAETEGGLTLEELQAMVLARLKHKAQDELEQGKEQTLEDDASSALLRDLWANIKAGKETAASQDDTERK